MQQSETLTAEAEASEKIGAVANHLVRLVYFLPAAGSLVRWKDGEVPALVERLARPESLWRRMDPGLLCASPDTSRAYELRCDELLPPLRSYMFPFLDVARTRMGAADCGPAAPAPAPDKDRLDDTFQPHVEVFLLKEEVLTHLNRCELDLVLHDPKLADWTAREPFPSFKVVVREGELLLFDVGQTVLWLDVRLEPRERAQDPRLFARALDHLCSLNPGSWAGEQACFWRRPVWEALDRRVFLDESPSPEECRALGQAATQRRATVMAELKESWLGELRKDESVRIRDERRKAGIKAYVDLGCGFRTLALVNWLARDLLTGYRGMAGASSWKTILADLVSLERSVVACHGHRHERSQREEEARKIPRPPLLLLEGEMEAALARESDPSGPLLGRSTSFVPDRCLLFAYVQLTGPVDGGPTGDAVRQLLAWFQGGHSAAYIEQYRPADLDPAGLTSVFPGDLCTACGHGFLAFSGTGRRDGKGQDSQALGRMSLEYFCYFLLAAHHRQFVRDLSAEVALEAHLYRDNQREQVGGLAGRLTRLRGKSLDFLTRGVFFEGSLHPAMQRAYQSWRRAFQVESSGQEVFEQLKEMQAFVHAQTEQLSLETERRTNLFLALLTVVALPITVIAGIYGTNHKDWTLGVDSGLFWFYVVDLVVLCGSVMGVLYYKVKGWAPPSPDTPVWPSRPRQAPLLGVAGGELPGPATEAAGPGNPVSAPPPPSGPAASTPR